MKDFFFLLKTYGFAFSVELFHLPLLFTNHEDDFRLREGSTYVVLAEVLPSFVVPQCLALQPDAWL